MPFTIIDSSIQFRPLIGSASICRRSTFPDTCAARRSTSGDSLVTVTVSSSEATFKVKFTVAF
jgi:hypothetical protein